MPKLIRKNIEVYCDNLHIMATGGALMARSDDYGWFVDENYILPFYVDHRLIFRRMVFATACLPRKKDISKNDEKHFLNSVIDFIRKQMQEIDFIGKAQSVAVFGSCPDGSDCIPWGTYVLNIDKSREEIFASFSGKTRNMIRRAIKKGVTVEKTNNIDIVCEMIQNTFARQNSPYVASDKYFRTLYNNLSNNIELYLAKYKDVTQSVCIISYDSICSYYWYSGSLEKMINGANNLLLYQVMVDLTEKGIKEFNFVGARLNVKSGTKYGNINKFKLSFNPDIKQGYSFRYVFKPLKFFLYNSIVKIYFKLKGVTYIDPIDQIKNNCYD